MTFKNLASERVRLGMNQGELASELKVSVKMIVKYENDPDSMPADFVRSAAEFFKCSSDYLLGITDERKAVAR